MKGLIYSFLIAFSSVSFAAEVTWTQRYEGSQIVNDKAIYIQDGDYTVQTSSAFTDVKAFSYLRLGLNERVDGAFTSGFESIAATILVNLDVTSYDNSGAQLGSAVPITLSMEYFTGDFSNIDVVLDASDYRMPGAYRVEAVITGVTFDGVGASGLLEDYVYLEAGFIAERYYALDVQTRPESYVQMISYNAITGAESSLSSGFQTVTGTEEIYINWDYIEGAEYYDLEWTWVDNYSESDLNTVRLPSDIDLTEQDFKYNSTRIRTSDQHYRIPNVFAKGYLIYRVRGVGRWLDATDKDLFGKWSSDDGQTKDKVSSWISSGGKGVITIDHPHEDLINWQYQSTYAEEGKKKEVVQYFDGSLRGRQTVTRINSDNRSVVGETIYDNEGRGVIQILPVPQKSPAIRYYESLNITDAGTNLPYSHFDFDWETSGATCDAAAANPMSLASGASAYYSATNPITDEDWQQYVADAKKYPFTQVEYTPDNTGRIRNQSGVGADHKIGSSHETYYYYTQPSQEELNRLFGYKVGFMSRYKKNIVVDANGQASVSYLDAQGRVIATAMAGDNPEMFNSLNSEENGNHATSGQTYHTQLASDLLNKATPSATDTESDNNDLFSTGRFGVINDGLEFSTQLGVPLAQTEYEINYDILTSYYSDICSGTPIEYPFVYDLKLSLIDDCGNEKLSQTYNEVVGDVSGSLTDFLAIAEPTVSLSRGSYTLRKELTINEAALEVYVKDYLSNACILTENDFWTGALDCNTTCAECADALGGSAAVYIDQVAANLGLIDLSLGETIDDAGLSLQEKNEFEEMYGKAYELLLDACLSPCELTSSCDMYYQMMLADVSPLGQYGAIDTQSPEPLSVFTTSGNGGLLGNWFDLLYLDENDDEIELDAYNFNGTISLNNVPGSVPVVINVNQLPLNEFIENFQPIWAKTLIQLHPEYPLLDYTTEICTTTVAVGNGEHSSEEFDAMLREQINTSTLASSNSYGINFLTGASIFDQDPYFSSSTVYGVHNTSVGGVNLALLRNDIMEEALTSDYQGTGVNMLSVAYKSVMNPNNYSSLPTNYANWAALPSGLTQVQLDEIWQLYKSYYLSYKAEINQFLIDVYGLGLSPSLYNGCIGNGNLSTGVMQRFSGYSNYSDMQAVMNAALVTPFLGSTPIAMCDPLFNDKEFRIGRVDNTYNPSTPIEAIFEQTELMTDVSQWEQTGLCPLTIDMERLLDELGQTGQLTSSTDMWSVNTFVPDLFEAFTGSAPIIGSNMLISGALGTTLDITFQPQQGGVNSGGSQTISITAPAGLNWSNPIYGVYSSYQNAGSNTIEMIVLSGATLATAQEFVVSYTSTVSLASCQAEFADALDVDSPDCEKEQEFESAMLTLLQALSLNSVLDQTGVSLDAYTEYTSSVLQDYFGVNATWDNGVITSSSATFDFGFTYTSSDVFANSFDVVNGVIYASTMTNGGSVASYSSSYNYTEGGVSGLPLDFGCSDCISTVIGGEFITDLLNDVFEGKGFTNGDDLMGAWESYGFETSYATPVIYNWNASPTQVSFEIYDESNFVYNGETIIDFGPSCTVLVNFQDGFPCQSEPCPSLNPVFNILGNNAQGYLMFETGGNQGYVQISCVPCQECTPEAVPPVSCNDLYDYYVTEVRDQLNYTSLSASEQTIFDTELLLSEEDFCDLNVAYIAQAYSAYLSFLNITDPNDIRYLSITEFGSTALGYSNGDLATAAAQYWNSTHSNPANLSAYLNWTDYVSRVYLPLYISLNGVYCLPKVSPGSISLPAPADDCFFDEAVANVNAQFQHTIYLNQMAEAFKQNYIANAMSSVVENLVEKHDDKEYHYTLYYYDRGGNLVQTVPPSGAQRFEYDYSLTGTTINESQVSNTQGVSGELTTTINAYRIASPNATSNGTYAPNHKLETNYRYNSLNQLVWQHTPDGGISKFAYDNLGRLVVSQNDKQKDDSQMSYTVYDGLGRVVEVGEMDVATGLLEINENGRLVYNSGPNAGLEFSITSAYWINQASSSEITGRQEVTRTIYDELSNGGAPLSVTMNGGTAQNNIPVSVTVTNLFGSNYGSDNTRNRITGVIYQETYSSNINSYESAIFYDYDVHGNVSHLINVYNDSRLVDLNQHVKHTVYEYDLVSGNVNEVVYQSEQEDQFMHKYFYDADNRIRIAETSKDGIVWEKDAKYFYYAHGPLARTELGESKVQALDYAYTIQGWLKTVNGEEVDEQTMMGQDGSPLTLNSEGARDAFGFSLSYFDDDYESGQMQMLNHSTSLNGSIPSLYNGNIRSMHTALIDVDENMGLQAPLKTHRTIYGYDQLNRINSMDGAFVGVGFLPVASGYSSTYSFDANGNLQTLTRNAHNGTSSILMDDFKYKYQETTNGGFNNQLSWVDDEANAAGSFTSEFGDVDIDGSMNAGNYGYDDIGQLIRDDDEGITSISWKVTNKVEEVQIDTDGLNGADKFIHFDYDPMGNRIAKHVTEGSDVTSTFYILDAQGNPMGIYSYTSTNERYQLSERNLYGSSRLGAERPNQLLGFRTINQTVTQTTDYLAKNYTGDKTYELSNHLGNVLEVITDRKLPNDRLMGAMSVVDYYTADVISYSDYYPYGMLLPESCQDVDVQPIEEIYSENFSERSCTYNGWSTGSPFHLNSTSEITYSGELFLETNVQYGNSYYQHVNLLIGEQYMITMDISHTATTPVLYVSDGTTNLFSSLQQGTNSYTFTATAATMFIGVAETGVPSGVSTFSIDDVELVHLGFSTVTVYQEDFSQRNVKCNGWNVGSPQYNNTNTEISSNGKLHIETTALYGGSKYDHTLVVGEQYKISMHVTHSSTSPILYAFDGSLTSTVLQQGYNELTFTAGSSNVTIGVGETVTPSGTSTFDIDNVTLIRLNGALVTESLCYGNGSVGDYRYGYQGQEHDDEVKGKGNSYNFGARFYDPRVARWLSRDAKESKYPNQSPYHFANNSPNIFIDINGDENIIVIGSIDKNAADEHKFINSGLKQLELRLENQSDEKTTIALYTVDMSASDIQEVKDRVTKLRDEGRNVDFVQIDGTENLVNYINSQTTTSANYTLARENDPITNLDFFGHGYVSGHNGESSFEPGHGIFDVDSKEHDDLTFDKEDVELLIPKAFSSSSRVVFYSCNAAVRDVSSGGYSLVSRMAEHIPSAIVVGWWGKTDYAGIYDEHGKTDHYNRNDGMIGPSDYLPVGGEQYPNTQFGDSKESFVVRYKGTDNLNTTE